MLIDDAIIAIERDNEPQEQALSRCTTIVACFF
jgi:hypothetical protein